MDKRVLAGLLAAVAIVATVVTTRAVITPKCGQPTWTASELPHGNAGSGIFPSPTEEYWTEERMRDAQPAPMPTVC